MLTYTSVVRASVEGLADTFIGSSFFGAAAFLFGLDSLCLFRRKPFLVQFLGGRFYCFITGEAEMASSLEPKSSFLEFMACNFRLACLGGDRMRAERVVAALLWFYKYNSGS